MSLAQLIMEVYNTVIININCVDIGAEEVVLKISSSCTTAELASKVPEDSARYHLYRFKHTHQGDYRESNGED